MIEQRLLATIRPRRRRRKAAGLSGLLLAIIVVIITIYLKPQAAKSIIQMQPGMYQVTHINDGDTIIVKQPDGTKETVRLLGADTPEVKDPRKPVQCYGETASAHTKALIAIGQASAWHPIHKTPIRTNTAACYATSICRTGRSLTPSL